MKALPLHDRIMVRRIVEAEKLHAGLLHIPDAAKEKPQEGLVLAAGTGRILESGAVVPLTVQVGDRILFGRYAGTDLRVNDQEVLVLREDEVLAILRYEDGDVVPAEAPPAPEAVQEMQAIAEEIREAVEP